MIAKKLVDMLNSKQDQWDDFVPCEKEEKVRLKNESAWYAGKLIWFGLYLEYRGATGIQDLGHEEALKQSGILMRNP